ncbi:DNA-binding protein [Lactococcus nasutitermitis]|uniref:DNA-binding protein n=1 Tax=Lactococcus nasutitermitis TaxID=1652957 RepID=A0ABV9JB15_9LACT|nr:DNA-binding protein [Lactococcus nasutitermitis]
MDKIFATKKELSIIFGVPVKTINKDITEMRLMPEFTSAVLRPSYRRVLINIKQYQKFLEYKSEKFND